VLKGTSHICDAESMNGALLFCSLELVILLQGRRKQRDGKITKQSRKRGKEKKYIYIYIYNDGRIEALKKIGRNKQKK
jgi:hypothetical protein